MSRARLNWTSMSLPTITPPINTRRSRNGWRAIPGSTCTTRQPHRHGSNLVERFFGDLTAFITERSFASTRELADAIITFLAARNDNPRRYVWKAKGEDILRKIDTARRALAAGLSHSNSISETSH